MAIAEIDNIESQNWAMIYQKNRTKLSKQWRYKICHYWEVNEDKGQTEGGIALSTQKQIGVIRIQSWNL